MCLAHDGCWCRFWVRQDQLFDFFKHWLAREALLQDQLGFFGLQVRLLCWFSGAIVVVDCRMWQYTDAVGAFTFNY